MPCFYPVTDHKTLHTSVYFWRITTTFKLFALSFLKVTFTRRQSCWFHTFNINSHFKTGLNSSLHYLLDYFFRWNSIRLIPSILEFNFQDLRFPNMPSFSNRSFKMNNIFLIIYQWWNSWNKIKSNFQNIYIFFIHRKRVNLTMSSQYMNQNILNHWCKLESCNRFVN